MNDPTKSINIINTYINDVKDNTLIFFNEKIINMYYNIGREIYINRIFGNRYISMLSRRLLSNYPGKESFTEGNLYRMKTFFEEYKDYKGLPKIIKKIPWTHNNILIEYVRDKRKRIWYAQELYKQGWTIDELINHIEDEYYEKSLLYDKTKDYIINNNITNEIINDKYTFDINKKNSLDKEVQEVIIN